ncbi:MliC family protein [Glaesserella sp.]|uniref:MliC family protein n=1 Tax=Glaesserella sp. TaxID=2094731 RepID=UPI00359FBD8E
MIYFRYCKKIVFFTLTGLFLSGCIAPVEQVQMAVTTPTAEIENRTTAKKVVTINYLCANQKVVRVQVPTSPKDKTITVIFNQTSHKLSSAVTKRGKKYSNIRWIWLEANGKGTLHDNRNNILAENCLKTG